MEWNAFLIWFYANIYLSEWFNMKGEKYEWIFTGPWGHFAFIVLHMSGPGTHTKKLIAFHCEQPILCQSKFHYIDWPLKCTRKQQGNNKYLHPWQPESNNSMATTDCYFRSKLHNNRSIISHKNTQGILNIRYCMHFSPVYYHRRIDTF